MTTRILILNEKRYDNFCVVVDQAKVVDGVRCLPINPPNALIFDKEICKYGKAVERYSFDLADMEENNESIIIKNAAAIDPVSATVSTVGFNGLVNSGGYWRVP